ncbi:ABC transporter substrate-binding protein [Paenibacillus mendelii]|uniref:ABC transporter substrate-binding protein n=1 Tax=Paenibacillus mendelii TaxID=206163 RepID=A0ABV6JIM1_9BACL|nr:extracellular solute-binding protein [Paenibacillus mendelii]MCQ6558226.1 extracellular solute-binding protein [Paenibacillus mendelii]
MKKKSTFGSMMRKGAALCLSLTLMGSLLAACSKGDGDSSAEKRVLRIGFVYSSPDNEQYLRQLYTDGYELLHPELDIQIVGAVNYDDMRFQEQEEGKPNTQPDPYKNLTEMLNGKNPVDVVVLDSNSSYLKRLVQDNMLKQLDPLIQENEFDIEDFVPAVIDGIKEAGDNSIYALTPTFNSSALYYNKKIFTDMGVAPPTDDMMWEDVLAKAKLVSKGEGAKRTFGLSFGRWGGDPFWDMQNSYLPALQLKVYDDKGEKMTVNSPQWAKVFTTMSSIYKEKIVPTSQDINSGMDEPGNGKRVFNPYQGDLFINGRVAMTIGGYDYVTELTRAKDQNAKNSKIPSVDWDVVTMPQHTDNPGIGGNVYLSSLMGINAKASNSEDAWNFIAFNNGKEWAKLKSRSMYEMVSRKSMLKLREGQDFNIEAFYKLKPVPPSSTDTEKLYREKPGIDEARYIGQQLFQEVIEGKKTTENALKEWETKGNAILKKIKDNPNGTLNPIEGNVSTQVYAE